MANVKAIISSLFKTAVRQAYPTYCTSEPMVYAVGKFGDYNSSAAREIAKTLKQSGTNVSPQEVAKDIIKYLPSSSPVIEKCEIADPGHINISLQKSFVSSLISDLLIKGARPPPIDKKLKVIVDFSSPNVGKEMHVGHLRSTIIGETICRLLEFVGHDVLRLNHIGDWGTQFGMLIAHLKDKFPNYSTESPSISDLQMFYKESKERFDNDSEFKARAYSNVVLLQKGDPEMRKGWKFICDVSRQEFESIYERLGVTLIERGESFYQPLMEDVVNDLNSKGLLTVEEGRTLMYVKDRKVPLIMIKSDGGFTYDTSDVAALRHRVQEEKGDWLIYVVDSGQGLHLETAFDGGKMAGYAPDSVRIDHVGFGVVLGKDKKKLKSRSGDTVKLKDLLDEGLERSLARLKEMKRDTVLTKEELDAVQKSVTYGCIKYADLLHTRTSDYVFSFDKMLKDHGKTAVYLLYTYARIKSIIRLAGVTSDQIKEFSLNTTIDLSHEKEFKLAKCIIKFPEILSDILEDLFPHILCNYVYELCTTMTEFYKACYCVESDKVTHEVFSVNMSRILLLEATRIVLSKSFDILGLEPVDKM